MSRPGSVRRLPALAEPAYRRVLLAAFIGTLGTWMSTTALGWLVLDLTDSPAMLGLAGAVYSLPTLLLSLPAGVLADRVDRRRLILATQAVGVVVATVLAFLTSTGLIELWHVVVLAGLLGGVYALGLPAFQAIVAMTVARGAIGNAVALNSAQYNLARILGPAIAGAVIALGGLALAFWGLVASYLLVASVLLGLRLRVPAEGTRTGTSAWGNLVDGIRHAQRHPTVRVLVLLPAVPALLLLNYMILLPVYARDVLDVGAPGLGALTGAVGVGAVVGAVGLAVLRPSGGSGRMLVTGLGIASVALIVFALSRAMPLSLAALAVYGAAQVFYYSTTNTLLQVLVPGSLRGRVMSLYVLTYLGVIPLGNLLAGAVAERLGPTFALVAGGVLTIVILGWVVAIAPQLRGLRATSVLARETTPDEPT